MSDRVIPPARGRSFPPDLCHLLALGAPTPIFRAKRRDSAQNQAVHGPSAALRILPLIEQIYDAASRPERWHAFLVALAKELGEPAIVINMAIPNRRDSAKSYRVHSEEAFGKVFADLAMRGELPWPMGELAEFERFVWSEEFLSSEELEKTEMYRRYMEPQGFLCEGQTGHVLAVADGRPLAAIGIYRREGGRPLTAADAEILDLLVPHLRRAYAIHCELSETRYRSAIAAEAINRFPMGVLFINRDLKVVESNRAAARIAAQQDGFAIENGVPQATASVSAASFSRLLKHSLNADSAPGIGLNIFAIQRPSGRQPYEALVAILTSDSPVALPQQAVAAVFIADPEDQRLRMPEVLATLYNLTGAEAELASLLSAGNSIDEAAKARNVTAHTVRTQLKQIFSKTGVSRQTDLVRLLSASVAGLEGHPPNAEE